MKIKKIYNSSKASKTIKIAQPINQIDPNEGTNPQENTTMGKEFEDVKAQEEITKKELGQSGTTETAHVLSMIANGQKIGPIMDGSWVAEGAVGWFKFQDVIYQILVTPASQGKYFNYFKSLRNKSTKTNMPIENNTL